MFSDCRCCFITAFVGDDKIILILSYLTYSLATYSLFSVAFTKRLSDLRNFLYTTRLSYLGLDSLQCRRTKADLSMCYKIINNYICTRVVSLFTLRLPNKPRVIPEIRLYSEA